MYREVYEKDPKRYSHSRLSTFKQCPLKHHYSYVEGIETRESPNTIPGKMFHEAIELYINNKSPKPIFEEFSRLCLAGEVNCEPDLLEYIFNKYVQHYSNEFSTENNIKVEAEYHEQLEGDDYVTLYVDQIFEDREYLVVRDRKTSLSKLKYTPDDVRFNQQLLLYVPFVEEDLNRNVDAIEIDEIRLAKLQPVPLLRNGKPTVNKNLLDLVTYEEYYNTLADMGLEMDREFQPVLDYLEQRGHPLFQRIRIPLIDRQLIDSNAAEFLQTYKMCKFSSENKVACRTKGPLCNFCAFQKLCKLDYYLIDEISREAVIKTLK